MAKKRVEGTLKKNKQNRYEILPYPGELHCGEKIEVQEPNGKWMQVTVAIDYNAKYKIVGLKKGMTSVGIHARRCAAV